MSHRATSRPILSILLSAGLLSSAAIAATPGDALAAETTRPREEEKQAALEAFKKSHESVLKLVKKKAKPAKVQAEVDKLLDYKWLAETALGGKKKYAENCAPKCGEFEELLTRLIRSNYLKILNKAVNHPVNYVGQIRGRRGAYKVTTEIKVNRNGRDQIVEVAYVMHQLDGNWQVRDIITDSLSLAKNYRFELSKVRKKEGIDGVIARLQAKLAELDSKPK